MRGPPIYLTDLFLKLVDPHQQLPALLVGLHILGRVVTAEGVELMGNGFLGMVLSWVVMHANIP
jgi:hypothetical protein